MKLYYLAYYKYHFVAKIKGKSSVDSNAMAEFKHCLVSGVDARWRGLREAFAVAFIGKIKLTNVCFKKSTSGFS